MDFPVFHEADVAVVHQHSKHPVFLGVVNRQYFTLIDVLQLNLLVILLFTSFPVVGHKLQQVVVVYNSQSVVLDQLHDFSDGVFPELSRLVEPFKQHFLLRVYPIGLYIGRWGHCGVGKVLQKFAPLYGTAIVDVDILEQFSEFIVQSHILGLLRTQRVKHQPYKFLKSNRLVVGLKL